MLFTIWIALYSVLYIQPEAPREPLLEKEVSIMERTASIKEILVELGNAGGFTFSYGNEVPAERIISVKGEKKSIRAHLDLLFEDDSLDYVEKGKKVLIIPSTARSKAMVSQTVRGRILDTDSKQPLVGVNVLLDSEGPQKGTITDGDGYFRFKDVPVGRHAIKCSYVGYESRDLSNLVVGSGKEVVVDVEMVESVYRISEVKITNRHDMTGPINDLAVVSGRSFSSYEVENYPGTLSDISRVAISYPGVVSPNDGQNHIVIRGNSPKGLQWRLEGIEIPNLNHFSNIGASGGGVNVVSNNMLAASDFLTGAFPAEYGNALSGVFDMRLRTGNNERHEQTFQLGLIGTEVMVEGPISRSNNTTYIAQYRYSTLKLLEKMGIDLNSVPDFQDLSFKIYHPTRKLGIFSLFGIGGLSHETGTDGYEMNSNLATIGLSNSYPVDDKTFVRTILSGSWRSYSWYQERNIGSPEVPINRIWDTNISDYTVKGSLTLNRKINSKHKIKAGVIYEMGWNDSYMGWYSDTLYNWYSDPSHAGYLTQKFNHTFVDATEHAGTLQAFTNWSYRIGESVTLNTGAHFIQFYLNNNYSIEPRLGIRWNINSRHTLAAGAGIHSRKESMTLYTGELTLHDGTVISPNRDLELSKARHYVLGYKFHISDFMHLNAEAYYQDLYDIPAYPFPPYFSTINFDYGFEGNVLTNYGTGYNTGIEAGLERYMINGFHFMLNGSLYDSRYENKLGEKLHTKYNGSYAANGLIGKEFKVGTTKQHALSVTSRFILAGGMRQLPIDREASIENGKTVYYWDNGFSEKNSDYFRIDVMFKLRRNKSRYSGEWSLDLMNILNRQNMLYEYWDISINDFRAEYQNPFLVFINYRIQF